MVGVRRGLFRLVAVMAFGLALVAAPGAARGGQTISDGSLAHLTPATAHAVISAARAAPSLGSDLKHAADAWSLAAATSTVAVALAWLLVVCRRRRSSTTRGVLPLAARAPPSTVGF